MAVSLASAGVAGAQEASAGDRRVEIPELGLAVTLPDDWDVVVPMLDQTEAARREVRGRAPDSLLDGIRSWLALWSANEQPYPQPGVGGCMLHASVAVDPTGEELDLDDLVATDWLGLWNDPGFERTHEEELQLPVGRVSRIDFVEHADDGEWMSSAYRFVIDDGFAVLQCLALDAVPGDRWRSIAETLERLPAGAIPPPRAEIRYPADWVVREPSLDDAQRAVQAFDPASKPLVRSRSAADSADRTQSCRFVDWSLVAAGPNGYEELTDALTGDVLAGQRAERQEIVDSALVDLPAGRAARVDSLVDREVHVSRWHFTDGTSWFYLSCAATEPPDDRWGSIARTFRFEAQG